MCIRDSYWGKKGGITVSGGEPLRQMEFLTAFFELARSKGVHTALDTAGQPFRPDDPDYLAGFDRLMKSTSLVILDLKEICLLYTSTVYSDGTAIVNSQFVKVKAPKGGAEEEMCIRDRHYTSRH